MSVRHPAPLQRRLLVLVAVALLPVVILAIAGLLVLGNQQRHQLTESMVDRVRLVSIAVDNELYASVAALEMLSLSHHLDTGDLKGFYEEARRALAARPSWSTVVVFDSAGVAVVNAAEPPGSPPTEVAGDGLKALHADPRPVVGDIAKNSRGALYFPVRVPVIRDNRLRYVLAAAVKPEAMLDIIARQKLPGNAVVSIFDSRRNVVARSRGHAEYVGQPVSRSLMDLIGEQREGWGMSTTLDRQTVYSAFSRSSLSEWGVALGIPERNVVAPIWGSYAISGAGILLSIALGILAAALLSRRIAGPIADLRRAAQAVGRGEVPEVPPETIPEVHEVASALAAAAAARAQADRAKDEFLAMLGHELRNPLSVVSNAILLMEKREGSEEARQARRIIARQTQHLTRLTDDLLDVGRVMTGKIMLDLAPLDLAEAVQQSMQTLRATGSFDHHTVTAALAPVWIGADRTRVEQIVSNLMMNAVKYTPAGGAVEVSVKEQDGMAVLSVRDNGIGMNADLVPRVYDLFFQAKTGLDRSQGGLGIGLTLVRRLAELHGGSVSAESDGPGRGSTFAVRFPVVAMSRHEPVAERAHRRTRARRILIVEDNDDARAMLRQLLELDGHDVSEAADGNAGLQAALQDGYDVAFVDVGLPGMDGYELARRLRAARKGSMRLVALSGYGQPQDRQLALDAGYDVHIVKPAGAEVLSQLLADLPDRAAA